MSSVPGALANLREVHRSDAEETERILPRRRPAPARGKLRARRTTRCGLEEEGNRKVAPAASSTRASSFCPWCPWCLGGEIRSAAFRFSPHPGRSTVYRLACGAANQSVTFERADVFVAEEPDEQAGDREDRGPVNHHTQDRGLGQGTSSRGPDSPQPPVPTGRDARRPLHFPTFPIDTKPLTA